MELGLGAMGLALRDFWEMTAPEFGLERRIALAMAQAERQISENVMARIIHSARRGGVFARLPRR